MIDPVPSPVPEDETVILSKDIHACADPFTQPQITIAELGALAPTVSLYRFVDNEETAYLELNGDEMTRLIEAYTTKHSPMKATMTLALQCAKNRLEQAHTSVCPDLVASSTIHDLLHLFAGAFLAQEQQVQLETILKLWASYVVQSSKEQVN